MILQISVVLFLSLKNVGPIHMNVIKKKVHYRYLLLQFAPMGREGDTWTAVLGEEWS